MSLQSDDLVLVGHGIVNDQPPKSVHPRLEKCMHLRFAFARDFIGIRNTITHHRVRSVLGKLN